MNHVTHSAVPTRVWTNWSYLSLHGVKISCISLPVVYLYLSEGWKPETRDPDPSLWCRQWRIVTWPIWSPSSAREIRDDVISYAVWLTNTVPVRLTRYQVVPVPVHYAVKCVYQEWNFRILSFTFLTWAAVLQATKGTIPTIWGDLS